MDPAHPYPSRHPTACIQLTSEGFYGGIRLVQAACVKFFELAGNTKPPLADDVLIGYHSTIPFSVGLAGSSAIVTATVRALLRFYRLDPGTFGTDAQWAQWVMEAETEHLQIKAGLQDRVAQWFATPMGMDFSGDAPRLEPLKPAVAAKLQQARMYVVYSTLAEESGVVHASLKQLHDTEERVRACMRDIAAQSSALMGRDTFDLDTLCDAMDKNFDLRVSMLGKGMAQVNRDMVHLARANGLAGKQAGSGGAIVCIARAPISAEREVEIRKAFSERGFVLCHVRPVVA